jgi:hypothetical protein
MDQTNKNKVKENNRLVADAGGVHIVTDISPDPIGSSVPIDNSHVTIQDKFKNFISLRAGGIWLSSLSDMHFDVNGKYFYSVKGDVQYVYGGDKHEYVKGDSSQVHGKHDTTARASAKAIQDHITSLQEKKKQAFESTKGDKIPCPICKQKMLTQRGSELVGRILQTLKKYVFTPAWFPYDLMKLNKYLTMLVVPFMSETSNLALTGGKSCDHPNCKQGVIESNSGKYEAANKAAQDHILQNQDSINEHEKNISTNAHVQHHSGGLIIKAGLVKNDASPYAEGVAPIAVHGLQSKGGMELGLSQKGAMEKMLHHIGIDSTPGGDIYIDAANKLTLDAGSPGVDVLTTGHASIHAGSVDIVSNQSELILTSGSRTIIKGKNVKVDANDRSGGGSGFEIDSKHTWVSGELDVGGDLGLKGSLMMDGTLYAPSIVSRSTQYQTSPSAPCDPVSHCSVWNSPPPIENLQATALNAEAEILYAANIVFGLLDGLENLVDTLITLVMKATNLVKIDIPIDNQGLPTGYAFIYNLDEDIEVNCVDYLTQLPLIDVYSVAPVLTDLNGGDELIGMCAVIVEPTFIPVFNSPHNHPQISGLHNHWSESIAFQGYDTINGINKNRPSPNHVPTPPVEPSGSSPGDASMGDGCGGAGAAFGNVTNARNNAYGTDNPATATATFNADGTLNPAPDSSLKYQC